MVAISFFSSSLRMAEAPSSILDGSDLSGVGWGNTLVWLPAAGISTKRLLDGITRSLRILLFLFYFPWGTSPPSPPSSTLVPSLHGNRSSEEILPGQISFSFFVPVKSPRTPKGRSLATALVFLIITSNCYNGSCYQHGRNIHLTKQSTVFIQRNCPSMSRNEKQRILNTPLNTEETL